jgi:hypothetical protein
LESRVEHDMILVPPASFHAMNLQYLHASASLTNSREFLSLITCP